MEKKRNRLLIIASSLVVLLPMIPGIILWNRLPDRMATGFDFSGAVNNYGSKGFAAVGLYIMLLAIHLFVVFFSSLQEKDFEKSKAAGMIMLICPMVSVLLAICIYGYALGKKIEIMPLVMLFLGFMYLIIGNYLPKIRRNYLVGIKVKWTLESDRNWDSTARFSGYLMFIAGLLMVIAGMISFFDVIPYAMSFVLVFVISFVPVFAMVWYSYKYYCKHKDEADYFNR
ncbi:MAG: SdpI family protein [Butyrivibrio sp.]|nr:SdpI family protein [Butyrivibrio sp.]